jgi:nitrogen fixation-related uncharacterized protein
MTLGVQIVAGWMGFVVVFAIVLLGWAVYSGQLDDADALNRLPLDEKEPADWPGRATKPEGV